MYYVATRAKHTNIAQFASRPLLYEEKDGLIYSLYYSLYSIYLLCRDSPSPTYQPDGTWILMPGMYWYVSSNWLCAALARNRPSILKGSVCRDSIWDLIITSSMPGCATLAASALSAVDLLLARTSSWPGPAQCAIILRQVHCQ